MKCVVCRGEDVKIETVKEEVPDGSDIVMVTVNVLTCASCGERYYDRQTMKHLEQVRIQVRQKAATLTQVGKVLAFTG